MDSEAITGSVKLLLTKSLCSILIILFTGSLFVPVPANSVNRTNSSTKKNQSVRGLRRLDFRLEGKSCATCLLSIQRKLNSLPGVKQAVVMLKRPYGVSVIYCLGETKQDEILAIVQDKEPNVRVLEVTDAGIGAMPSLLIPPFVPLSESP